MITTLSGKVKSDAENKLKVVQEELKIREKMNDINAENRKREKVEAFGFDIEEIKT
jgi:hypothetical protein